MPNVFPVVLALVDTPPTRDGGQASPCQELTDIQPVSLSYPARIAS